MNFLLTYWRGEIYPTILEVNFNRKIIMRIILILFFVRDYLLFKKILPNFRDVLGFYKKFSGHFRDFMNLTFDL